MTEPVITFAEILAELERDEGMDETGLTLEDIAERVPWGVNKTRRLLRAAINAGTVEVHQVKRQNVMRPGWNYWANCYRLKQ